MNEKEVQCFVLWKQVLGNPMYAAPATMENLVITVSLEQSSQGRIGFVEAWDPSTGSHRWSLIEAGDAVIGGGVMGTPSIFENGVYVAGGDGVLRCLNTGSGQVRWTRRIAQRMASTTVITQQGIVVAAGTDGVVMGLDPYDGSMQWSFNGGGAIHATPWIEDDLLYVACWNGIVYALGIDGVEKARVELGNSSPIAIVASQGLIVLHDMAAAQLFGLQYRSSNGKLVIEQVWQEPGCEQHAEGLLLRDGAVYTVCNSENLLVCREASNGTQRWEKSICQKPMQTVFFGPDIVVVCRDGTIAGCKPETGDTAWQCKVDLTLVSPPALLGNVIYIGGADDCLYALKVYRSTH